ncbi:DUF1396 domain-containing protein [Streptomyces sp. NPDC048361]|uniref:DUF1396 domain-containing protein n=1 Tax=Streptomyces sp. NPDC048361 TaxID=3154720 RepID=UPI003414CBF1
MRHIHRNAAAAVLAGVLVTGLAACSGGDKPAASKSVEGAKDQAAGKPAEATFAAAVKRAAAKNSKLTSLSYTVSGKTPEAGVIDASASMSMKPPAMQMKAKGGAGGETGEFEIRLVDNAMYMSGGEAVDGKSWLKFDLNALGKKAGGNPLGALGSQVDKNPAEQSGSLTAAKDLKKIGEETLDGVKTTHYAGTVTLDQLRDSLQSKDTAAKERGEETLKQYEQWGISTLQMDMWIDGQDHTKQFRTQAASVKGPLDLTAKFLDYNKPITVQAPPADQVADLAEMMKGATAGATAGAGGA